MRVPHETSCEFRENFPQYFCRFSRHFSSLLVQMQVDMQMQIQVQKSEVFAAGYAIKIVMTAKTALCAEISFKFLYKIAENNSNNSFMDFETYFLRLKVLSKSYKTLIKSSPVLPKNTLFFF